MTDATKPAQTLPPMPGTMWLLGRLIADKIAEAEHATLRAQEAGCGDLEGAEMERVTGKKEEHHAETHND